MFGQVAKHVLEWGQRSCSWPRLIVVGVNQEMSLSFRARWAALAVLLLPVLLIAIDSSVLGIAIPAISAHLRPTSAQLLWIIDLYSFLLAGLLVLMGSLGDRYGRRLLLMIGAPTFALASLAAAFATTPGMLIAARGLLGLGGATLMPATLGLLRSIFPSPRERRIAIAVWASAFSGGTALGPVLGGMLLEHFWWGSVFLINVPIMVLFLVSAALLLPESKDPQPGRFDVVSAAYCLAGLLPVVYALKTLVRDPQLSGWVALAVGAFFLGQFLRRQRRISNPMLELELFTRPGFATSITINVLTVFAMLGLMFFLPQYLMLVQGKSAVEAGLMTLPLALATIVGSMASPAAARIFTVRSVITIGLLLVVGGMLLVTRFTPSTTLALIVVATSLIGTGQGLAQTLTNDIVISSAPPHRAGAASAISETGYEFGAAMGTAVLGTIGLAVYASGLSTVDGVTNQRLVGVTAEQFSAAQETLGEALAVASTLGGHPGTVFRELATSAFVSAMDFVAYLCAAAMAGASLLAWFRMRIPPLEHVSDPGSQLEPEPEVAGAQ